MGGLFNMDSPFMRALGRVADLLILNFLVVLLCLPVITAGAAFSAMHYVLLKMARGEEGYIVKSFFKSFKENFRQATVLWLIVLVFVLIFILDFIILRFSGMTFPRILVYSLLFLMLVGVMLVIYIFALQSHFVNTVRGTLKNAVIIMIANLPRSVLMLILTLLPIVLLYITTSVMPFVLLLGISFPAYGCALIYSPVFKKFEGEDETEADTDIETDVISETETESDEGTNAGLFL